MYTLYDGFKTAGGTSVRAVLAELCVTHDIIELDLKAGEHRASKYTRINPGQQVPALRLPGGEVLTETIAILTHLADCHPKAGLIPECGSIKRAKLIRWMSVFAMHVYEGENRRAHPESYTTDPAGAEGIARSASISVSRRYDLFEAELGDGPFLLGSELSIFDVYVWVLAQWWPGLGEMSRTHPKTFRLVEAVAQRPAIRPIHVAQFRDRA